MDCNTLLQPLVTVRTVINVQEGKVLALHFFPHRAGHKGYISSWDGFAGYTWLKGKHWRWWLTLCSLAVLAVFVCLPLFLTLLVKLTCRVNQQLMVNSENARLASSCGGKANMGVGFQTRCQDDFLFSYWLYQNQLKPGHMKSENDLWDD